ncbi:MAG: hypothetical protein JOZ77_06460 [Candidatus Eremiobacteraeota bacterium]|nr:hypothetical protein [Candidatus Eremiobacteraeota bacterium]
MESWPPLHYESWKETVATLHMWTQIVGKIRLMQQPLVNHWWNVTLYPTSLGLTTSPMPYKSRSFEIAFDFVDQELQVDDSNGERFAFALEPMSVAAFYRRLMDGLRELNINVAIHTKPSEVADAIPFELDTAHCSYDGEYVQRWWRVLSRIARLCKRFRAPFLGKASPTHFFWGAFDLAQSLFSGRAAPPHPGGIPNIPDTVTREGYSHEVFSVGFWPGGHGLDAMLYAYIYPLADGFDREVVQPAAAGWNAALKEFVLPYEALRTSPDPDRDVLAFFTTTYRAAASCACWDRAALERPLSY